ncbi:MAG: matrixin family metalloprotease [Acidobacteriota bacterium]|nr:matrixin family metalloprotease [Acidobacteriota bacterium]
MPIFRPRPAAAGISQALMMILALMAASLSTPPAGATSFVMVSDENLVVQAEVIAVVRVATVDRAARDARGGPATEYGVHVEELLKGALAGGTLRVNVPGGLAGHGLALKVYGAPSFRRGERALLFLEPQPGGTFRVLHLMLGAFHEAVAGKRRFALRNLGETTEVQLGEEGVTAHAPAAEPIRDFVRFTRWVAGRVHGGRSVDDYRAEDADGRLRQELEKFTLFADPSDGQNLRWFAFDTGESVPWLAHQTPEQGVADGGYAEFQTALHAWTVAPITAIKLAYTGTTSSSGGLTTPDGKNEILFNDGDGSLPAFDCARGGVLGEGGPWYQIASTPFLGQSFHRIVEADVVINSGLTCFFTASPNGSKAAEELFGHELGHTLGLGHSSLNEALMRSFVHDDGRGARLASDDIAGVQKLYPPVTNFFTVPPCRLVDTRNANGPALLPLALRTLTLAGTCGVPASARALSVNITVTAPTAPGDLRLVPADLPMPETSSLNFKAGQTRANNAVLFLSSDGLGNVNVQNDASGTVELIVDVNGYFQ